MSIMHNLDRLIRCPITTMVFKDPVVASDGYIYEKETLYEYIKHSGYKSPINRVSLSKHFHSFPLMIKIINKLVLRYPLLKKDIYYVDHDYEGNKDFILFSLKTGEYSQLTKFKNFMLYDNVKFDNTQIPFITYLFKCVVDTTTIKYVFKHAKKEKAPQNVNKNIIHEIVKGYYSAQYFDIIKDNGFDITILDDDNNSPLQTACKFNNYDMVVHFLSCSEYGRKTLLNNKNKDNKTAFYMLFDSSNYGSSWKNAVKKMIECNAKLEIHAIPINSIMYCLNYNINDILSFLLGFINMKKDNIVVDGSRLFTHLLVKCKDSNIIKKIINDGVDLNYVEVNSNVMMNSNGYMPIHFACRLPADRIEISKMIINKYDDLNIKIKDDSGHTPIAIACRYGNLELISYLVFDKKVNIKGMYKFSSKEYLTTQLIEMNENIKRKYICQLVDPMYEIMFKDENEDINFNDFKDDDFDITTLK